MNESGDEFRTRIILSLGGDTKGWPVKPAKPKDAQLGKGDDPGRYGEKDHQRKRHGASCNGHPGKDRKRHEVKVGKGEPIKRLTMYYPTKEIALAAARSELDRRERRKVTVSGSLPGRTDLEAEGRVILSGVRDGVDGEWSITRANHSMDGGRFTPTIEAEQPNDSIQREVEDVGQLSSIFSTAMPFWAIHEKK